ncbi:MAG: hypothetical protein OYG32_14220, partial [Rhodospirillaceae bacterium]|nr:hypothetical protein [Rhodospirillaceae bacterium]
RPQRGPAGPPVVARTAGRCGLKSAGQADRAAPDASACFLSDSLRKGVPDRPDAGKERDFEYMFNIKLPSL